jgi:glutamate-1-semialdehyde 2,1-aminomutase
MTSHSAIIDAYVAQTPGSARINAEARQVLAGGMTTDTRLFKPYGPIFHRAQGVRKFDVDDNEYLDFFGGHGALMLGHGHPDVVAAATAALSEGCQFAAGHPRESEWASRIKIMLPVADKVRFTASGTEATLLAIRLARAFTARPKIVRFRGHYHGWHDHACSGYISHFDGSPMRGLLPAVAENVILIAAGDSAGLRKAFKVNDDIAAVLMEPNGGHFGTIPQPPSVLPEVRELCDRHGSLLILDEVVSAFRIAPGGAQAHYGVHADLTTLGKILAGGLPGGGVTGREEIMDLMDFDEARRLGGEKIMHQGTFNGHPVSAAAGIATLDIIASTDACAHANLLGEHMRAQLNQLMKDESLPWAFYGESSVFHFFTNPLERSIDAKSFIAHEHKLEEYMDKPMHIVEALRTALLVQRVDVNRHCSGFLSAAHSDNDIDEALGAFEKAIHMVKAEIDIPAG